ncbi:MAG: type II toxin-antitoxin system PemK/MazF family toxin, partial [Gemmataceae bacterium]
AGLPRPSVVVVGQVSSVPKASLGSRIGALSSARVEQVLAGLRFQQASFFVTADAAAGDAEVDGSRSGSE